MGEEKGRESDVLVEVLAPPAELQSAHLRPCQLQHMREQWQVSFSAELGSPPRSCHVIKYN